MKQQIELGETRAEAGTIQGAARAEAGTTSGDQRTTVQLNEQVKLAQERLEAAQKILELDQDDVKAQEAVTNAETAVVVAEENRKEVLDDIAFRRVQELDAAKETTLEMQLHLEGEDKVAAEVQQDFEYRQKIVQAIRDGNGELAQQLRIQQEITAQQKVSDTWKEGMQKFANNLGSLPPGSVPQDEAGVYGNPKVQAALKAGFTLSQDAISLATNTNTGQIDYNQLVERMIEITDRTQGGHNLGWLEQLTIDKKNQALAAQQTKEAEATTQAGLDAAKAMRDKFETLASHFGLDFAASHLQSEPFSKHDATSDRLDAAAKHLEDASATLSTVAVW